MACAQFHNSQEGVCKIKNMKEMGTNSLFVFNSIYAIKEGFLSFEILLFAISVNFCGIFYSLNVSVVILAGLGNRKCAGISHNQLFFGGTI